MLSLAQYSYEQTGTEFSLSTLAIKQQLELLDVQKAIQTLLGSTINARGFSVHETLELCFDAEYKIPLSAPSTRKSDLRQIIEHVLDYFSVSPNRRAVIESRVAVKALDWERVTQLFQSQMSELHGDYFKHIRAVPPRLPALTACIDSRQYDQALKLTKAIGHSLLQIKFYVQLQAWELALDNAFSSHWPYGTHYEIIDYILAMCPSTTVRKHVRDLITGRRAKSSIWREADPRLEAEGHRVS